MRLAWLCSFAIACGTEPPSGQDPPADPIDPIDPTPRSALEACIAAGGTLAELWSVGNQHGPVTAIAAGTVVVLGAEDGSVKQWTVDGADAADGPSYGAPFATAGARVGALALAADGHVLAATAAGEIAEWRLADARLARTHALAGVGAGELSALATDLAATAAIAGTSSGRVVAVDRATQVATTLPSSLWGVAAIAASADMVVTAGHWYGTPMIERRAPSAPGDVADSWNDQGRQGSVTAVAVGAALLAAGDGFVARFDPVAVAAGPIAITEVPDHRPVGLHRLPGGELFATAGAEGTLRLWAVASAAPVASLPIAAASGLAADLDGTRLFTSGPDGRLHAYGCRPGG